MATTNKKKNGRWEDHREDWLKQTQINTEEKEIAKMKKC